MRRGVFVLAVLMGAGRVAFGCSSDAGSPQFSVDAGHDVVLADAATDRPLPPPDQPDVDDPDPAPPAGLPDGWQLERTYSKHCGLYIPTSTASLPAPLTWEPCPISATPSGADCRLLAGDGVPGDPSSPAGAEAAWVKADGSVVLGAYRSVQPGWIYQMVADADGPLHNAFLVTEPKVCLLATPSIDDVHSTFRVFESGSSTGGGVLANDWTTDALSPLFAIHLSTASSHTPYAGPFAILDLTAGFTFDQYAWANGARLTSLWSAAQDDGLQQGIPVFAKGAAFWPSSNLTYHKVKVYTPAGGVSDLLTAGALTTRGFADLGTDGTDMAWIDANGRTSDTSTFDTYTIMTSPFATAAAQVVGRRVRSEQGPSFDVTHFYVGGGYAARSTGLYIRIVRLVDGQSWILANDVSSPWGWSYPLAITSTELFAMVNVAGSARLARVRLDSLGPGIAPD